jgi:hypothetical protein
MSDQQERSETERAARFLAASIKEAINSGWVARGFQFGIGLWLAGIAAFLVVFFLFGAMGIGLLGTQ